MEDITIFIPHRDPIVFLKRIMSAEEGRILCQSIVDSTRMTGLRSDRVGTAVTLEIMGQAMAAHGGLEAQRRNERPKTAMIVSVRNFVCHRAYLKDGEVLMVEGERESEEANGAQYQCRVFDSSKLPVASARITIAMREDSI